MRRGDVVSVAVTGDFGEPRPAVIVQTDGRRIGHLEGPDIVRLNIALALVMGLAD